MDINVSEESIKDAVRAVVEEEMPEAVRHAVLSHAKTVIKEAVDRRVGPVVEDLLANEQFVVGRYEHNAPLDSLVRGAIKTYLDERVYLYSDKDDRPSVRFNRTTHNNSSPTRLEAFLRFSIERFCDEHLAAKLEPIVAEFINQRGGIEQVAREQMAALLKEKFKL